MQIDHDARKFQCHTLASQSCNEVVWTDASHPLQHGTQAVAQSDPVGLLRQNLRFVHRRRSSAAAAAGVPLAERGAAAAAQLPRAPSASAAAAAAIHWPPPLEIPQWLEEVHDVPEAFRCGNAHPFNTRVTTRMQLLFTGRSCSAATITTPEDMRMPVMITFMFHFLFM